MEILQFFVDVTTPRRIPYDSVKAAVPHRLLESLLPVEDVDAIAVLFIEQEHLLVLVEIRSDQGIATLDVVAKVREGALVEEPQLGFAFQHFEQQGKLCDFDRSEERRVGKE